MQSNAEAFVGPKGKIRTVCCSQRLRLPTFSLCNPDTTYHCCEGNAIAWYRYGRRTTKIGTEAQQELEESILTRTQGADRTGRGTPPLQVRRVERVGVYSFVRHHGSRNIGQSNNDSRKTILPAMIYTSDPPTARLASRSARRRSNETHGRRRIKSARSAVRGTTTLILFHISCAHRGSLSDDYRDGLSRSDFLW